MKWDIRRHLGLKGSPTLQEVRSFWKLVTMGPEFSISTNLWNGPKGDSYLLAKFNQRTIFFGGSNLDQMTFKKLQNSVYDYLKLATTNSSLDWSIQIISTNIYPCSQQKFNDHLLCAGHHFTFWGYSNGMRDTSLFSKSLCSRRHRKTHKCRIWCLIVYELPRTSITKCYRQGDFNNRNFHSSRGRKSKIKVPRAFISDESSLFGLQMAPSSCVLTWPFLWALEERALWCLFLLL